MSESPSPPESTNELQFTIAEPRTANSPAIASGQNCFACGRPIADTYYALGDKVLCPACCERASAPPGGSKWSRFLKASLMGVGAGLVGALIWFVIRRVAHLEIGLVSLLVGYMVGKSVNRGSGYRGGRGYQVLAVTITYCCIAVNYMPDVLEAVFRDAREKRVAAVSHPGAAAIAPADPAAGDPFEPAASEAPKAAKPEIGLARATGALVLLLALVFAVSLAAPFLAGAQNLMGLLIIGFALWEAWKFNARRQLPISGPYRVGTRPAV